MSRPPMLIALVLPVAFLLHDGWMAHAGHIVYEDDHAAMTETSASGHHDAHRGTMTDSSLPADAIIAPDIPAPTHETCITIRIGAPNPVPGVSLGSGAAAILPSPPANDRNSIGIEPFSPPPSQPPTVRRALLQVYLI
ncbi:MAG: hypothetical protein QM589_09845 [Thermomicrobiales bacterium]